jgi:uncharacterized membrane protein YkoI
VQQPNERKEHNMRVTRKYAIVGGAILALAAGGTGVAVAVGGGDDDEQATGPGAERAKAAALEITGGGTVDGVEQEGSGYEVEVTKPDGQQVEIALDSQNRQTAGDSEDETDENESGEDQSGEDDE